MQILQHQLDYRPEPPAARRGQPRPARGVAGDHLSLRVSGHYSRLMVAIATLIPSLLFAVLCIVPLFLTRGSCLTIPIAMFGGATGLYFAFRAGQQLITTIVPTPIVELSSTNLQMGDYLRVFLHQPGPLSVESLKVELLCVQQRRTSWQRTVNLPASDSNDDSQMTITEYEHHTYVVAFAELLSEENVTIPRGAAFERTLEERVPQGRPTGGGDTHNYWWVLRVAVRAERRPALILEFPVIVS